MNRDRLAALLTCYNRSAKTLASLTALFNQEHNRELTIDVYLVDDGSTDDTAKVVSTHYPQVKIIPGTGNLFWNGGMRLAFAQALQHDYDYYLWLNDDTILYPKALDTLLATAEIQQQKQTCPIITGSTCDLVTQNLTYGGVVRRSMWRPLKFELVQPTPEIQGCDTMNGNCVLLPRSVVQIVGNLDPAFTHYAGDWDYGLRATKQGCTVWIAPGYVGTCSQNYQPNNTETAYVQLKGGIKKISQPKGLSIREQTLHPLGEWKVFAQRYAGFFWPIFWLIPYRRLLWISLLSIMQKDQVSS